jgi:hypothetical protein
MSVYEYTGNIHIHTPYSDGTAYHGKIAQAAGLAGLDFLIVTDHNLRVAGVEGYYGSQKDGYVLLLTGEEVHDRYAQPMANHCLVLGAESELSGKAHDIAGLVNDARKAGGMVFAAHPHDKAIRWQSKSRGIPWTDWSIDGLHGLEVWNYMSGFKSLITTPIKTLRNIFSPEDAVIGPNPETLAIWDHWLAVGRRVVGIGGSDAHGNRYNIGPFGHTIFPYDYLFNCVNTHILTPSPLAGQLNHDKQLVYHALQQGRAFVGYDLIGSTCGFRFTAQGGRGGTSIQQGGGIRLEHGVTLQVRLPYRAHIKLIRNGDVIADESNVETLTHVARQSGAFRVEVWQMFKGAERCWILSNPIYIEPNVRPIATQES